MIVRSDGPPQAKIAVVGEAPGAEEERLGKPFVGASGYLLDQMLADAGISRSECWVSNVCQHRPPSNDITQWISERKTSPSADWVKLRDRWVAPQVYAGHSQLLRELSLIKPNIIIATGNTPMWALTGHQGVMKWRGSQLHSDTCGIPGGTPSGGIAPFQLIPTIHPAAILREWKFRQITVQDLRRASRFRFARWQPPAYNFILRPDYATAINVLVGLKRRLGSGERIRVAFDIETRSGHIACIGLAWSRTDAICIPFMCSERAAGYWDEDQEREITQLLGLILTAERCEVIGQNIIYDAQYTWKHWGWVPRVVMDTMIAQHALFSDLPKSLAFLASMYADHYVYWKDEGKLWEDNQREDELWNYNCLDCVYTFEVAEALEATTRSMKMEAVQEAQQDMLWPVLRAMQLGIHIDQAQRAKLILEVQSAIDLREKFLLDVLGHPINPDSPKQMMALFYDDLKLPLQMTRAVKGKAGHATLNDDALQKLAQKEPLVRPLVAAIGDIRTLRKFLSNFLTRRLDADGRWRCSFNIGGSAAGKSAPKTYRLSSSESAFDTGCFPPGAEVLTPHGWIAIETVVDGQVIATYSEGKLSWRAATPYRTNFKGKLRIAESSQYYTCVTPGHRILATKAGRDNYKDYPAADLGFFSCQFSVPVSGQLQGGTVRFTAERLLVAALADGSYDSDRVRFSLKKPWKATRLIELCAQYGVELFEGNSASRPEYRRFWFRRPADWPEDKRWASWVYELAPCAMEAMIDELRYWDATIRGKSCIFFTADRRQAELVQDLAHLSGNSATLRVDEQNAGSYSTTTMYCVNVKPRSYVSVEHKHWSVKDYDGEVYCVSVNSSYFLVKQEGRISITGNSNLQNIPSEKSKSIGKAVARGGAGIFGDSSRLPNLRSIFVSDTGYSWIELDLQRADLFVVCWEADDAPLKAAMLAGADLHLLNAFILTGKPPPPLAELVEGHPAYAAHRAPMKLTREFAKVWVHGTNYGGQPRTMSAHTGRSIRECENAQRIWFSAHPGIERWHARVRDEVQARRSIANKFGYRWHIFDRLDSIIPEAIAWVPQSTVSIVINKIWMQIFLHLPWVQVLAQVHDSLCMQCPSERLAETLPLIEQCSKIVVPYSDPLTIPVTIKTSPLGWGSC